MAAVWKTVLSTNMLWPASQMPSSFLIKSEFCHSQEFSDEDTEEDIDALMSAHSKIAGRRLSSAVSTVTPVLKLLNKKITTGSGKSCMLRVQTRTLCIRT